MTSDGGALLLRQADRRLGLTAAAAAVELKLNGTVNARDSVEHESHGDYLLRSTQSNENQLDAR